ncbi:MAG: molybdopterin molybdotransferase MoeA [Chthoniobacterales bacterium]
MTVDGVWELLRREISAREAVRVELADAMGAVLREDLTAPEDQPAFDRSAVDGFVVRRDDDSEAFRVTGEVRAGDARRQKLSIGEALRMATGAAVPEGGEVIMLEDAVESGGSVRFARRGCDHVRRRGEDARAGDVLLAQGAQLGPGAIALLASAGCVRPRVTRAIDVLHVATGNELVPAEEVPGPGQIRDSNSPLVAAWAQANGLCVRQKRVGEDAGALIRAIEGRRDLLLVSGGASVGGHDCTAEVLEAAGFELLVTKVAVRPGKPLIVGRRGEEWAFGLPGNPLSHFVCLHVFVEKALAFMRGATAAAATCQGRLLGPVPGHPRETWWPALEEPSGLRPLPWTSSGDLTALATANVLVRVPASGLAAGPEVEFIRAG